ncbi:MAG: hypothetical protein U1E10_02755 [Bdellovibrionales bacterium]|nr:hypothetical protein [Bdellovibrionales bacterium]
MSLSKLARTGRVLAALFVVSAAMGCSVNQDPFEEKSDQIKNGIPPELDKEPPVPKPLASDALRIDALDFYTFREEVEGEISISGRVLTANPQFELTIDSTSLKDFPGAVFDGKTGVFKWTPPRESTGTEYGVPKRLVVRLTAPSPVGGAIIGTTKAILVYVTRSEVDPQILTVDDLVRTPVREGELRKFTVTVRDPDSIDADGLRPRLVAVPSVRGPSDVSGLVYMQDPTVADPNPVQDPMDKKKWIFKMVLDLRVPADMRGRDFTRAQDKFKFGLQVTSRFGRVGYKNDGEVMIWTDVMKPEISWFSPIEVIAGQENVVQFTIYDPYAEGKLTVNFQTRLDQLPGSAISKCISASREGNILCTISWKPLATTTGDFKVDIEVINQSKIPGDIKIQKELFQRTLKVKIVQVAAPVAPAPVVPVTPTVETPTVTPAVN